MDERLEKLKQAAFRLQDQDFVVRYQGRHTVRQQNIAEHMAHVTQYLVLLFSMWHISESDQLLAMKRACIHDLPETETADVPFITHCDYPAFSEEYDHVEASIWLNKYSDLYAHIEKGSIPWLLVKVADKLDVIAYIQREQEFGNNSPYLKEAYIEEVSDIKELMGELDARCSSGYRVGYTTDKASGSGANRESSQEG